MGSIEIEVMSDECETCFLDWPIDHVIWIESENGNNGKFQFKVSSIPTNLATPLAINV